MASAYLSALWEEGTVDDLRKALRRDRDEVGDATPVDEAWTKRQLFDEICRLYDDRAKPCQTSR